MKRKGYISLMVSLIAASLTAAATGTISWFINHINVDLKNDITGSSNGAYFARGTGTSGDPFIINDARHFYNLAWLQYLGYFNKNILGASEGSTYFEIDSSLTVPLDMSGWILPPIGTSLYPFVGNFNGNGKVISGLNTINSSTPADYIKYPSAVRSAGTVININVLGAFGVYGTYNLNNSAVYPVDDPETTLVPAYTETCSIRNVTFDNSHVTNYQTSTIAGIAVGYVNAS
ncbi:MAG: hypothetical protein K6C32_05375, partial [Bacilli bacterium]|nr:hypothetical protein [Bacilli bacterium]